MKYYKNLIERKKYSVSKTWYLNDGYGIISVVAASNMGMVLCGVLLAYIGFWTY